jgi:superfamily II DNA or RNA helicase
MLRTHQKEAARAIIQELMVTDRVQVVMACATGKTYVASYVVGTSASVSTVVFVPSLSLINQFVNEWREVNGEFRHLCVANNYCDVVKIKEFCSQPAPFVIFCTYQSSHLLSAAEVSFDVGIFDEAHRTAGKGLKRFSIPMHDDKIRITKRIFMTATPRYGRGDDVSSMDDTDFYGKVVYNLPFSKAIERKIITPYKIVICSAKEEDLVLDDGVTKHQALCRYAVSKAIRRFDLKRVITFHANIKSAWGFAQAGIEGAKAFHINGFMNPGEKQSIIDAYNQSERGVISNVKCMAEGIDIPTVDMVAFLNPRRSLVDIIQAVGRVMRLSSNKEFGYILIPVMIPEGKGPDSTLYESKFNRVWEVLNEIQSTNDIISSEIHGCGLEWSKSSVPDLSGLSSLEFLGEGIDPDKFFVKVISAIADTFYIWLGKYQNFLRTHGRQPKTGNDIPQEEHNLGNWCIRQRTKYKAKELSKLHIDSLKDSGFILDLYWERFEKKLAILKKHIEEHDGRLAMTQTHPCWKWLQSQKRLEEQGRIREEARVALDTLGVEWRIKKRSPERFDGFKEYLKVRKRGYVDPDIERNFVIRYRSDFYKGGRMSEDLKNKLHDIGFPFDEKSIGGLNIKHSDRTIIKWDMEASTYIITKPPKPSVPTPRRQPRKVPLRLSYESPQTLIIVENYDQVKVLKGPYEGFVGIVAGVYSGQVKLWPHDSNQVDHPGGSQCWFNKPSLRLLDRPDFCV